MRRGSDTASFHVKTEKWIKSCLFGRAGCATISTQQHAGLKLFDQKQGNSILNEANKDYYG
jgi:hypothetical protein